MTQRAGFGLEALKEDKKPSFREHMAETWKNKPDFHEEARKPETIQKMAIGGYWIVMNIVVLSAIFYSIPEYCRNNEDMADKKIYLILLVLFNAGIANINWMLASMTRTQIVKESTISEEERRKLMSSAYLPYGYKFCHKCSLYAPPRSFHCSLCNGCVLKRDYHCYITGACVGITSQRRIIVFLFHIMVGCFMHMLLSGHYVNSHVSFRDHYIDYVPFMAFYRFSTGEMSSGDLYFLFLMFFCLTTMVISSVYLAWQWLMVIRGQTSYEATRSIQTYRMGFFKSMHQVFGSFWWMNFIFPMITTLPTDGVHWERRGQNKTN